MLTDGTGNLFFGNPGSSQWLNGTSGTISYSSGSIGINTTTPLALLSIVGSSTSTAPLFDIASSTGASLFRVSPNGNVTVGTTVLGAGWYDVAHYGAKCDGTTDDTAAINAANAAINAAGGGTLRFPIGTCLIAGHVVFPNDGLVHGDPTVPYSAQSPIRWSGAGPDVRSGQSHAPVGGTILKMTYSGAGVAKIESYGLGIIELDHMTFWDPSGDSLPFFYVTGTDVNIHDTAWVGSKGGVLCDQDVIMLGGPGTFPGSGWTVNDPSAPGQNYQSTIYNNWFNQIRRALFAQHWTTSVEFSANAIMHSSGSNLAGGAAVEVNSTNLDGSRAGASFYLSHNRIEMPSYAYGYKLIGTVGTTIEGSDFEDGPNGASQLALVRFENATNNFFISPILFGQGTLISEDALSLGTNTVISGQAGTTFPFGINSGTFTVTIRDLRRRSSHANFRLVSRIPFGVRS
jgi:hypothetical protein